jgi:hypothetical protein
MHDPKDSTYNGWENYPTWCTHLWLTNDSHGESYWRGRAADILQRFTDFGPPYPWQSARDAATHELATVMREELEGHAETLIEHAALFTGMLMTDLLMHSLGSVNFHEIAEALLPEEQD